MILERSQRVHRLLVGQEVFGLVRALVPAEQDRVDRCGHDEQGRDHQEPDRDRHQVRRLADAPGDRRARRGLERPGERRLAADVVDDLGADRNRVDPFQVVAALVEERLERLAKLPLAPDLLDSAAGRVHVARLLLDHVRPQEPEPVVRRVAVAVPEDLVEPGSRSELRQVLVARDVEVREVDERGRHRLALEVGRLLEQEEPREVHLGERAEVEHRPVRDAVAHRRQQLSQRGGLTRPHVRRDGHCGLLLQARNSSAKSRIFVRSQYTIPRYVPGATSRISSRTQCATSDVPE